MNPFEHVPKEENPYTQTLEEQVKFLTARKAELAEEIEDATEKGNDELVRKYEEELKLVERDLALAEAKTQGVKKGYDWTHAEKEGPRRDTA